MLRAVSFLRVVPPAPERVARAINVLDHRLGNLPGRSKIRENPADHPTLT
jgi:hypothetical protein